MSGAPGSYTLDGPPDRIKPLGLKAAAADPFSRAETRTPAWGDRAAAAREQLLNRNQPQDAA